MMHALEYLDWTRLPNIRRRPIKVADPYKEMLDAIIDQRGSNGGWPPRSIPQVAGWMVVKVAARTFHKSPAQVAADLIKRWELVRR